MTDVLTMSKLSKARLEFIAKNIKKNGHNDYSKYDYFRLDDILTPILQICDSNKLFPQIVFNHDEAVLTIYDLEKEGSEIVFKCPYDIDCAVKGAQAIQNEGAKQTYVRRYLYMAAFEISEPDFIENMTETQGVNDDAEKYRSSLISQLEKYGLTVAKLVAYKGALNNIPTEYLEKQLTRFKTEAEKKETEKNQEAVNG